MRVETGSVNLGELEASSADLAEKLRETARRALEALEREALLHARPTWLFIDEIQVNPRR